MKPPSYLQIRNSQFGKGLFAKKDIPENTVICTVTGPELSFDESISLGDRESHSLQVDKDKYLLCQPPFLYSNHSCEPNSGLNANLELVSLKIIKAGEEIFWDYSTSMLERHWTMNCLCGAKKCRKIVTDFDLLPEAVQADYLNKKIVLPFIVQHIQSVREIVRA
jgi:uncharacterized protein